MSATLKNMSATSMKWLVGHTAPNCERKLLKKLSDSNVQAYVPIVKVVKQWSDRKKTIEVPIFRNYIFIKIDVRARWNLLTNRELIRFLQFGDELAEISEDEIEFIMKIVSLGDTTISTASESCYRLGDKVAIKYGTFSGYTGYVTQINNKKKINVHIHKFEQTVVINIDSTEIIGDSKFGVTLI